LGRIRDWSIRNRSARIEITSSRIEQVRVFLIRFPWDAGSLEQSGEILSAYGRVAGQICRDRRDGTTRAVWIVIVEDSQIASSFLPEVVGFGRVNAYKSATGKRQSIVIGGRVGDVAGVRIARRDKAVDVRSGRAAV